ncbi:MAG TPA: cytochrome c [Geopsychrobacteraceae bacterium]|nr:cytochrome c [Geopsychrobacteraceae bacterium]
MMLKKMLALTLALTFVATTVFAIDGGNPRKGKYLFKKNCKSCHSDGAEGGDVTPLSKTQSQWDRMFKKAKHDPKAWEGLSEKDLLDINQFLFDHASDSDQPETCG